MTNRLLLGAAMIVLAAGTLVAQPLPRGKWWQRPEMVQRLGLTDDQQTRLDNIWRGAANDLIDLRGNVEKMSIAVHAELDQPQINRDNLRRAAGRLSEAQGRLFERELMMLADMRGVLNDQQWSRLRTELERPHMGGGERPMQRPQQPRQ